MLLNKYIVDEAFAKAFTVGAIAVDPVYMHYVCNWYGIHQPT